MQFKQLFRRKGMALVCISSGPEPIMTLVLSSSSLVLHQMMSAQISSGVAPQSLKMLDHSSSSLGLHCQKTCEQISSNLISQMSQRRLLASLQAPYYGYSTHEAKTGVYSFQVDEQLAYSYCLSSSEILKKAREEFSFKLVDEDEVQPAPEPHMDDYGTTITRPPKTPVVEVKGKGSATDRRIIASQDETTGPFVHHEDATSTKIVRETLSYRDAESSGNSEKVNSKTDT
ncbi:hypothetical protein Tco_1085487 [Tanacetum coccineum]